MSIKLDVQKILTETPSITDKVTSFIRNSNTYQMIFRSYIIPEEVKTDSGKRKTTVKDTTVIHYLSGTINNAIPFNTTKYTISCRAQKQDDCEELQEAVAEAFAQVRSESGKSYFTSEQLPLIPPKDNTDNWNGVIELKAMGSLN